MKSIQSKIMAGMLVGWVLVTLLVTTVTVNMTHEIMHKDADKILSGMAREEAAVINDVLGDVMLSSKILERYTTDELDSPEQLLDPEFRRNYIRKVKDMFSEIALNNEAVEGFYMRFNPEYTDSTTGFYTLITADRCLKDMSVTDLSLFKEEDRKNVGWYYLPIEVGEPLWLEPYYFPTYTQKLLSYATPIYASGKLLGVIGFDMNFDSLLNRVNNIKVYEAGYAVLMSHDGQTKYTAVDKHQGKDPHTHANAELLNGMILELRADYKDIQREVHPVLRQIVAACIAGMLCSVVYTIVMTRKIVLPLKRLIRIAEGISLGLPLGIREFEWDQIGADEKDEIGILSNVLKTTYEKSLDYFDHINSLVYRDSLTGVQNSTAHAAEISRLNHEIILEEPQFGVLVVDINNLKQTNDRYGHDVGNTLIIQTARLLGEVFQSSTVYRIGGDEFIVILTGEDYHNHQDALVRLEEACSGKYIRSGEESIRISLAVGLSLFDKNLDSVYEDVFIKADKAMYQDKSRKKAVPV